jgi:hypothetical protein
VRKLTSRLAGAALEGAIISLIVLALIAMPALAARGGNGGGGGGKPSGGDSGGSTISMVPMDSTDGLAHYGQRVTFDLYTTATDSPFVQVRCSQGGALVYQDTQGYFPTAMGDQWFVLGFTPAWQSGAADCTGSLMKYTRKGLQQLASTAFHVEP